MFGPSREEVLLSSHSGPFDRQTSKCLHSNSARAPACEEHADGQYQGSGKVPAELCSRVRTLGSCTSRVEVVDPKSQTLEREIFCESWPRAGNDNHTGCKHQRLGAERQGLMAQGQWSLMEKEQHINVLELRAAELALRSFTPLWQGLQVLLRQHDCCDTDLEDGVSPFQKMPSCDIGDLGVRFISQEHSYCSVPPRASEHDCQQTMSGIQGLQQLEAESRGVQVPQGTVPFHAGRPFCRPVESPVAEVVELEARSKSRGSRCSVIGVEGYESLRLPSIQTDPLHLEEGAVRTVHDSLGGSSVVPLTMVPNVAPDVGGSSGASSSVRGSVNNSRQNSSSDVCGRQASTGSLAGVRQSREDGQLSSVAKDLVAKARSLGTSNVYKSAWGKFSGWYAAQQANASSCPVEVIVSFLAAQQRLVQFDTLAGYRSAISFNHHMVDGVPIGRHPLVLNLMKGSFRDNPPVPRYTQTWDVQVVLSYLQELGPNARLTQKELTLKLAMLLALVCRAKRHELCAINTLRPGQNGRLSQTTLSNTFSWMKMLELILQHWFR